MQIFNPFSGQATREDVKSLASQDFPIIVIPSCCLSNSSTAADQIPPSLDQILSHRLLSINS